MDFFGTHNTNTNNLRGPDVHTYFAKNRDHYFTFPEKNDFFENDVNEKSNCIFTCGISCIFVFTLISLMFNSGGLYVGVTYNNATCYENKHIMSLSLWLIIITSVCIIHQSLFIIYLIFRYLHRDNIKIYDYIAPLIYKLVSSLFNFIMVILGIIELVHQYESCFIEVNYVTTTTIIIIIINYVGFINLCSS